MQGFRFAIALGGGSARGLAHIGVLEGLEEENIRPDFIVGTSFGALVGALFAREGRVDPLVEEAREWLESPYFKKMHLDRFTIEKKERGRIRRIIESVREKIFFSRSIIESSFVDESTYNDAFYNIFGDITFEELRIPLIVTAVDIISRREVAISKGELWKAVAASCALPGLFPPVKYNGMLLMDGGIIHKLPVAVSLEYNADSVLGVDVSGDLKPKEEFSNAFEILLRCDSATAKKLHIMEMFLADYIIRPELGDMDWNEFDRIDFARERGKEAVHHDIEKIRRIISRRYRFKKWITRVIMGDNKLIKAREFALLKDFPWESA